MARALMLQGTGSDVGKSLLLAGLARAFTRQGLRVRPFKPQNMSNNAAVTADGGEIGRAQALQARACGTVPVSDMNPVLLKPQSESGAQIIVHGRVWRAAGAGEYRRMAPDLLPAVLASFSRLAETADLVLVEGAGSPAEINLRDGDIANMGFAEAADVPVVLIGDIERGGVIAQLVGTHALLSASERALLAGFIVNKFRGDVRLFDGGVTSIASRTGLQCFGVVPYFAAAATLPAEDSLALAPHPNPLPTPSLTLPRPRGREGWGPSGEGEGPAERVGERETPVRIAVPALPRIANFDDLDPLRSEPGVELVFVRPGRPLPRDAALLILTGSKATIADLEFLRRESWDIDLLAHYRQGGKILGLCGGYQMLGRSIADPLGMEGPKRQVPGLGLLDIDTVLTGSKQLIEVSGIELATGLPVTGYEMHLGATTGRDLERPMLRLADRTDGAGSADGRVAGCYLHGLFASDPFRQAFVASLGTKGSAIGYEHSIDITLDALADHLERSLNLPELLAAARPPRLKRAA
jgi:adenosylcobyric acid synthase